ncbi:MAG: Stp1/IreP family PP2C-type Ser/Thr phosphatase, partial [Anaerolineae bacterium]
VADGMGGHNAGEIASQMAVAEIQRAYYADPSADIPTALTNALQSAHQAIAQHARSTASQSGMGTTVTLAVVREREVHVANVGDSRTYLLRSGVLTQVSQDHSMVAEQVRAGVLTAEQAHNHPQRNVITRALGKTATAKPDFFHGALQPGDTLILCSDGLSTMVTDSEIQDIVSKWAPADAARRLVDLANEHGGLDNISVIIVRAEAPGGSRTAMPAVPRADAAGGSRQAMPAVMRAAAEPPRSAAERRFPLWLMAAAAVIALLALTGVILLLQSTRGEVKATSPAPTLHAVASQPVGATATLASTLPPAPTAPAGDGAQSAATATLAPIATPDPSPIASQTAGAPKQPAGSFPPIVLLAPVGNITIEGDAERTFTWDWSGRLQADQGFQVLLWKDQTQPETAAEPVTTKTGSSWQQTIRLSQAPAVKKGGDGAYFWTVALIELTPYKQLGAKPAPRPLTYRSQKPAPRPTDTATPFVRLSPAPTIDLRPTPTPTPFGGGQRRF